MRFFIDTDFELGDTDHIFYLIPESSRKEWNAWLLRPTQGESRDDFALPEFAVPLIDHELRELTFESPRFPNRW